MTTVYLTKNYCRQPVTRSTDGWWPAMHNSDCTLGRCPDCGEDIPSAYLLIEYETDTGERGQWAECPECTEVVTPDT